MKAIMYHYVRLPEPSYPELKYLHADDFEAQLDFFQEKFGIVTKEQWDEALRTGKSCEGVILTFDDGLADHYDYVYPILKKKGLWGIFYVSSAPYTDKMLLDVHKVHLLLAHLGGQRALDELMLLVTPDMLITGAKSKFATTTYANQSSDIATKEVKKIINYYLKPKMKSIVLNELVKQFLGCEQKLLKKLYLSESQIIEMYEHGFSFGSHAKTHTLLSNLNETDIKKEVNESVKFINNLLGLTSNSFCYPYGGKQSYTPSVIKCLKSQNVPYAYSVESRDIQSKDLINKFELPRYDCNEFPYGQVRTVIE